VYTKEDLDAVKREPNRFAFIEYFTDPKLYLVRLRPNGERDGAYPTFATLDEAVAACDQMLAEAPPKARRYEPRKEFATYGTYRDPNLETR
jgi:hypothetical protein